MHQIKNLICKDCPDLFKCPHCSSVGKTINTTELSVNNLLKIRDNLIKISSQVKISTQRFADYLEDKSQHLNSSLKTELISNYLYSIYHYILDIVQAIFLTSQINNNYGFLQHDDYDLDYENGKISIPFYNPEPYIVDSPDDTDSATIIQNINDRLDSCFGAMIYGCYRCMMICPSKSPLAAPIEQTDMLSQQGELFKKSLESAIKELKKRFNQEIKELSKNNKKE